jgi:holin-like protein
MSGMQTGLRDAAVLIGQIVLLWLMSEAARHAAALLPFPVPGGAIGLVMLYLLLATGWLRLSWIERGAILLIRHLGLFLVPLGVGFMAFWPLMATQGIALLAVLIGCTALGIGVAGSACAAGLHLTQHVRGLGRRTVHE